MARRLGGRSRLERYVLVLALAAGVATCDGESAPAGSDGDASPTPRQTLFEILDADRRFDTLVGLVRTDVGPCCEGFEGVLGATTLTVFAPTDDAFDALPEGALDAMIDDGEELLRLIENHIAHGRYREADLPTGEFAVVAGFLPISRDGDVIRIGDATLVGTDVTASNGTIHVVDAVNTEVCFRIGDAEELTCQHLGVP